jgi:cold shock protein
MSKSETLKGTVKWFNDAKGFGFIEHNDGRDVFVHYSVIETDGFKTLKDGEEVVYEMQQGPKGLSAVKVSRSACPEEDSGLTETTQSGKPELAESESLQDVDFSESEEH